MKKILAIALCVIGLAACDIGSPTANIDIGVNTYNVIDIQTIPLDPGSRPPGCSGIGFAVSQPSSPSNSVAITEINGGFSPYTLMDNGAQARSNVRVGSTYTIESAGVHELQVVDGNSCPSDIARVTVEEG